jgi:hypothetical protein
VELLGIAVASEGVGVESDRGDLLKRMLLLPLGQKIQN